MVIRCLGLERTHTTYRLRAHTLQDHCCGQGCSEREPQTRDCAETSGSCSDCEAGSVSSGSGFGPHRIVTERKTMGSEPKRTTVQCGESW